jgi:hypothetical protein
MGISLALRRALFSAALAAPVLVVACGSRGPLDIEVIREYPDASASLDAIADVPGETSDVAAHDVLADVIDAAPDVMVGPDGGPLVNCGSCIAQSCGQQVITCITSTTCRTALQCVVQMCLTGGMPSLTCLGGCTGSDPTTQMDVLAVIGCIVGTCGSQCTGALGGLGGGGGGGGGSGGGAGG